MRGTFQDLQDRLDALPGGRYDARVVEEQVERRVRTFRGPLPGERWLLLLCAGVALLSVTSFVLHFAFGIG